MLKLFRLRAAYNILTPIALLAAGIGTPAIAATITLTAPATDYVMTGGDSLVNNSTISSGGTNPAVSAPSTIGSITNSPGANILGGPQTAIYVNGTAASISNSGFVSSTDNYGVDVVNNLTTFSNTGRLNSYYTGVYVGGDLGTFTNSGNLTSTDYEGVNVSGSVSSFNNSGTIQSDETSLYVASGDLTSFTNSASMTSDDDYGVYNRPARRTGREAEVAGAEIERGADEIYLVSPLSHHRTCGSASGGSGG